jgi:hypothetical protein
MPASCTLLRHVHNVNDFHNEGRCPGVIELRPELAVQGWGVSLRVSPQLTGLRQLSFAQASDNHAAVAPIDLFLL